MLIPGFQACKNGALEIVQGEVVETEIIKREVVETEIVEGEVAVEMEIVQGEALDHAKKGQDGRLRLFDCPEEQIGYEYGNR